MTKSHVSSDISCTLPADSVPPVPALFIILSSKGKWWLISGEFGLQGLRGGQQDALTHPAFRLSPQLSSPRLPYPRSQ